MTLKFLTYSLHCCSRNKFKLTHYQYLVNFLIIIKLYQHSMHRYYFLCRSNRRMDNDQENAKRKFALYSLYAWGCPLLIGIIGIVVDSTSSHPNTVLRPGFGEGSCFFPGLLVR